MANIVSAQGGNWEDTTTWVGGVVPSSTDDVTISDGHRVITTTDITYSGTLVIGVEGTTTTLQIGDITNRLKSTFTLSGANISGVGRLGVTCGHLKGTSGEWSTISVRAVIRDPVNFKAWSGWILDSITFKNSAVVDITSAYDEFVGISGDVEYTVNNCVFKNCAKVSLMTLGVTVPKALRNVVVSKTSFVDNTEVNFQNITITSYTFTGCFYKSTPVFHNESSNFIYRNCVVINSLLQTWPKVDVENCYFGTSGVAEARAVGLPAKEGTFNKIIAFCSENGNNSRTVQQDNLTYSFVEDISTAGGGNPIAGGFDGSLSTLWHHNVLIGRGDGFTSVLGEKDGATFNLNCYNNTAVTNGVFANNERYTPSEESSIKYYNNLHVCPSETHFIFSQNGMLGPTYIDADYNHSGLNRDWTGGTETTDIYVNTTGTNNVAHGNSNYPQFVDSTRNHQKYAEVFLGGTSYIDVWEYLQGITGYEETTGYNSGVHIADDAISNMHTWLMEGYAPTNMPLATAGEGGAFVGALEPKAIVVVTADISLKANANTVTIGDNVTYTLTLSEALPEDLMATVAIGNVNRTITISANALEGYLSFTTATVGNLVAQIKSTDNGSVTITGSIVNVVVNDVAPPPPQGKFFRPLEVATVDESHVNLTVPSGVTGELQITLTYTKG